jgi:hypothetical protein
MRKTRRISLNQIRPELFWAFAERQVSGCWKWIGQQEGKRGRRLREGKGARLCYGIYEAHGQRYRAHRVSYELTHGLGTTWCKFVCHTCDYPLCVNPDHLFLGNAQTNTSDMVEKGRARSGRKGGRPKGKKNRPRGRLTSTEIDSICRAYDEDGLTYAQLADLHSLSKAYVGKIIRDRRRV